MHGKRELIKPASGAAQQERYVIRFADKAGVDLEAIAARKIASNATKYPADKFRGSDRKYDEQTFYSHIRERQGWETTTLILGPNSPVRIEGEAGRFRISVPALRNTRC